MLPLLAVGKSGCHGLTSWVLEVDYLAVAERAFKLSYQSAGVKPECMLPEGQWFRIRHLMIENPGVLISARRPEFLDRKSQKRYMPSRT